MPDYCIRCMSFFRGLVIALVLSGIVWGVAILAVYSLFD